MDQPKCMNCGGLIPLGKCYTITESTLPEDPNDPVKVDGNPTGLICTDCHEVWTLLEDVEEGCSA